MRKITQFFRMFLCLAGLFLFLFPVIQVKAQSVITIGTGISTQRQPFGCYWGYERSADLYTSTEIGQFGIIDKLAWDVATLQTTSIPVKIYLKTVTSATETADTWANLIAGATLVYDATTQFSVTGWTPLAITAFTYASDNLLVLCETNYGGTGTSAYPYFRYSTATGMHQSMNADNNPPTTNGTISANRPNIQISLTPASACVAPLTQATGLVLASGSTTVSGSFVSSPDADSYLVISSTSSTLGAVPANGTTYTAGMTLGSGTVVGSFTSSVFNASSLTGGTQYYFFVFSENFMCSGGPLYLSASPLTGNIFTGPADPSGFAATASSSTQIDFAASANVSSDNIIVAWNSTNTFGVPTGTYIAGNSIVGGGTVLYVGSAAGLTSHIGLTPATQYFYKVWSINSSNLYSDGLTANATTQCGIISSFPWTEGFEHAGTLPACWTVTHNGTSTYDWACINADASHSATTGHGGSGYFAYLNSYFAPTSDNPYDFVSPEFDLSSGNKEISYWSYIGSTSPANPMIVEISIDNKVSWTTLKTHDHSTTDAWFKTILNLAAYNNTSVFFRFRGTSNYGSGMCNFAIDDLSIEDLPACPSPSSVSATNVTSNSASLTWVSGGASNWNIKWDTTSFSGGFNYIQNITTNPFALTGLSASTSYIYFVRDSCGAGSVSDWSGPFTFTTACGALIAPWVEHFDTQLIPNCWTSTTTPDIWHFTTSWPNYGAQGVADHTGTTGSFAGVDGSTPYPVTGVTLTGPFVDASALTAPELNFFLFNNNINDTSWQTLRVDLFNGTSWVDSIYFWGKTQNAAGWQEVNIPLSGYGITGPVQCRFVVNKGTGAPYNDDLIIDDVSIDEVPTCPKPTALTAANISAVSATLGWTTGGSANWNIKWDTTLFNASFHYIQDVNTNPFVLSGLQPSTTYQFYVRDSCGAGSVSPWAGPFTFTTPCSSITTFPYLEQFEGTTFPPACWERLTGILDDPSIVTAATSGWISDDFGNVTTTVNKSAKVNVYSTTCKYWLVTPVFDIGTGTAYQLKFDLALTAYGATTVAGNSGADDKFAVVISTDNGTTWAAANTLRLWDNAGSPNVYNNISTTGESISLSLAGYSGQIKIAFYGESKLTNADNDLFVDNVTIEIPPTCPAPSGLNATNVTSTGASLGWITGGASNWNVNWGVTGNLTYVQDVNTNPLVLTGLTPSTTYEFFVRDSCGAGDVSTWSGPHTFTTSCGVVTAPWAEHFDTQVIPNCWTTTTTPDTWKFTTSWPNYGAQSLVDHTGTAGSFAGVDGSTPSPVTGVTLTGPFIDASTLTTPQLNFFLFNNNINDASSLTLRVDLFNGTSWIDSIYYWGTAQNATSWQEINLPLSGYGLTGPVQFRFVVNKSSGSAFYDDLIIDDVSIDQVPTCPKPTALNVTNITGTTATLGWTTGGATNWNVQWGVAGNLTYVQDVNTNPYILNGLLPSTTYEFFVRDSCGAGDVSPWAGPFTFTTPCASITTFPYVEQFEGVTFPPTCWEKNTGYLADPSIVTSTTSGWVSDDFANVTAPVNKAAKLNVWSSTCNYWLVTPSFDLGTGTTIYELKFDLALTAYGTTTLAAQTGTDDVFAVVISTDNGTTWAAANTLRLWDNAGSPNVYNTISTTGENIIVSLSGYTGIVKIAFYAESKLTNADNDLFVDNVTVDIQTSEMKKYTESSDVFVYPNPSKGAFNVVIRNKAEKVSMEMFSSDGRLVYNKNVKDVNHSKEFIDVKSFVPGVYSLRINDGKNVAVKRLIIQ